MMRIGLIDVDGHNFPNFALMRLSAYHKAKGDSVEWADAMFGGRYDRIADSSKYDRYYEIEEDELREAYAALIDKISGKGAWESNPFVFVYDFELVKE